MESDNQVQVMEYQKLVCKQCLRAFGVKGVNTSDLAKHFKDRHPDLNKEFKVRVSVVNLILTCY